MAKWEQLIAARESRHLSQMEAAEILNVGVVTYQRWEAGKRKPQPHYMRRLCEYFGLLSEEHEKSVSLSEYSLNQQAGPLLSPSGRSPRSDYSPKAYLQNMDTFYTLLHTHMIAHLLSLVFMTHETCDEKRLAIRQAIKEFDSMNTDNKNYQITRREALWALASLPFMAQQLTTPGRVIPSSQYGNALAQSAASLEACWELRNSHNSDDIMLAFQSASTYQQMLETIAQQASQYREEALELATRYALIKTILGSALTLGGESRKGVLICLKRVEILRVETRFF